jgi:hypothetical protein
MRTVILSALMSTVVLGAACAERLDKRFGPEHERGYRSEREFESKDSQFKNRDRANFLGASKPDRGLPELPRNDLQAPAAIGLQR